MQSKIFASIIISFLLMTSIWAQEPPSWIPLGDIPWGYGIYDILEIPGSNIILVCGTGFANRGIWKTTNGGQSWSEVLNVGSAVSRFERDSVSGRIWTYPGGRSGANTLYFTTDNGQTWTGVSSPPSNFAVSVNWIEVVGNYLYYGGSITNPYSICLYRLHQDSLVWEMVTQYPQCNSITTLKFHNNKLVVFAKDKVQNFLRIFSYTPAQLDEKAKFLGKAETSEASKEK